ncbi:MAG: SWIM zinc finger family protein [Candidatus Nanopelagicales bacterium]
MNRGRWSTYYNPPPRREVAGGVVVPKPGKVTHPLAVELVAAAEMESDTKILSRGRTYARAGQVVAVQVEELCMSAQIQGTRARPYNVKLIRTQISGSDRVAATCSCPYGCDYGWCKHAAALAYVGAFLLERDEVARVAWQGGANGDRSGTAPAGSTPAGSAPGAGLIPASALMLDAADLASLRSPLSRLDADAMLAAAEAIVPHPARLGEAPGDERP